MNEHPLELILGSLVEMASMSIEEPLAIRNICEIMNRAEEAKDHQPD